MAKIKYTKSVFGATQKVKIQQEIITSVESSPELRKEIARVFQVANRRIQNIENKGILSPSVAALNKGDITGFSKFKMSGNTWETLKLEYAKAVGFLKQPTSTATGAKQYNEHVRKSMGLTKPEYQAMSDKILGRINSLSQSDFVEQYLMRYNDFTGDIEQEARDVSEQIESDAIQLANAIDENIQQESERAANEIADILNAFDNFNF